MLELQEGAEAEHGRDRAVRLGGRSLCRLSSQRGKQQLVVLRRVSIGDLVEPLFVLIERRIGCAFYEA